MSAKRHVHEFTALSWTFGQYGRQDVHVHSCYAGCWDGPLPDDACDRVLVGAGRDCRIPLHEHHRETLSGSLGTRGERDAMSRTFRDAYWAGKGRIGAKLPAPTTPPPMRPRAPIGADTMSEQELQDAVIVLAQVLGYRVAHFRPAKTEKGWRTAVAADGRGFPDLVLAKQGRVLFAELKTSVGLTTDAQRKWLDELGAFAYLWTPKQWADGTILRTLSAPPEEHQK